MLRCKQNVFPRWIKLQLWHQRERTSLFFRWRPAMSDVTGRHSSSTVMLSYYFYIVIFYFPLIVTLRVDVHPNIWWIAKNKNSQKKTKGTKSGREIMPCYGSLMKFTDADNQRFLTPKCVGTSVLFIFIPPVLEF